MHGCVDSKIMHIVHVLRVYERVQASTNTTNHQSLYYIITYYNQFLLDSDCLKTHIWSHINMVSEIATSLNIKHNCPGLKLLRAPRCHQKCHKNLAVVLQPGEREFSKAEVERCCTVVGRDLFSISLSGHKCHVII